MEEMEEEGGLQGVPVVSFPSIHRLVQSPFSAFGRRLLRSTRYSQEVLLGVQNRQLFIVNLVLLFQATLDHYSFASCLFFYLIPSPPI